MNAQDRRNQILEILCKGTEPVSGTQLSKRLKVSRQVIVQDIALLKAGNKNILATNKGYILFDSDQSSTKKKRTVHVSHTQEDILDELNTIVDFGGKALDVVVEHDIYGQITAELSISNRKDAQDFYKKITSSKTKPLHHLTDGSHYHTIEADDEQTLDLIEESLFQKGYLIKK